MSARLFCTLGFLTLVGVGAAFAAPPPQTSCKVGRSVYKIPRGTPREDVVKIIGCDGVLVLTLPAGFRFYQWTGKTYGAYIRIKFDTDDRLVDMGGYLPPMPDD